MLDGIIRREFNRWADQGRGRGMEASHWEITRQTIEFMRVRFNENIADLGCGVGWATRVLAEQAPRGLVAGMDLSDRMIDQARTRYRNPSNVMFVVADAARMPFQPGIFDALLSVESIYYYPDLEGAFAEVVRILRPGGRAFFLLNFYKENVHGHAWSRHIDIPVHLLGAHEYESLIAKAGLVSASHRRIIDTTPLPADFKPSKWFPTRRNLEKFRAEGALLLTAMK